MKRLFAFLFVLLFLTKGAYADFKLLDAIEEFGEKRYLHAAPANLHWGSLKFHPFLRKSVQYDNNILLEPDDRRGDVIYNITPGAIVELPIQKHQIAVGYEADFEIFSKSRHKRQNDVNQNFFVLGDFHFADAYINILENFSETSSRAGTTFSDRIPRYDQSINPKVGYKWKRVTFEQAYRHYLRDFRQDSFSNFDFEVHEWTSTIFYDLFARLKALIDYQHAQIAYKENRSRRGFVNQARIGLDGEAFRNFKVQFRIGPQIRNYGSSSEHDFRSFVVLTRAEYQLRQNLKLTGRFSREPVEATFGQVNYYTEHYFSGGFEYEFVPRWTLYHETGLFKHHYAERETVDNQTGFRRDGHLAVETGLKYVFRPWWQFGLRYEFLGRDSNFPGFDYADNRVTLTSDLLY